MKSGNRLLILFTFAIAIVLGGIVSLAIGSWWFLIVAIALHAIGTVIVLGVIGSRLQEADKPDPVTEARIAEEQHTDLA
jgi:hypothetical protein